MNNEQVSPLITVLLSGIVLIAIGAGAFLVLSARPQPVQIVINPPLPTVTPLPTTTPSPLQIYVTGAVANPESVYELPPASRVEDAIEAAGGFTDDANLELVNLAGLLRDGDQVHVPSTIVVAAPTQALELATPSGGTVVLINRANTEELQALPGIGPATAEAIVAYREENGDFSTLDDLDNVPGIGPATLAELAPLIAFD